jgi:hypothetical protein
MADDSINTEESALFLVDTRTWLLGSGSSTES